jgi:hypothetical protein
MIMTTNTNNTNNSATIENRELTDDELNATSGGIIFVGGEPVAPTQTISSASGSAAVAGNTFITFDFSSVTVKTISWGH